MVARLVLWLSQNIFATLVPAGVLDPDFWKLMNLLEDPILSEELLILRTNTSGAPSTHWSPMWYQNLELRVARHPLSSG